MIRREAMPFALTCLQYDNPDYLKALQFLAEDSRVAAVGLCNFDTKHLLNVVESGTRVYTNQVQVRRCYSILGTTFANRVLVFSC